MAEPVQFFTALSQASAGIAAFVIAISTVLYSIDWERRERRTQRLREALLNFQSDYEDPLKAIQGPFIRIADHERVNQIADNPERVSEEATSDDSPAIQTYAILVQLEHSIQKLDKNLSASEIEELMVEIKSCYSDLQDLFVQLDSKGRKEPSEFARSLNEQFAAADDSGSERKSVRERDLLKQVIPRDYDGVKFAMNKAIDMERVRVFYLHQDDSPEIGMTGYELHSIYTVAEAVSSRFDSLNQDKRRTLVGYEPPITRTIWLSGGLLILGVFLPLAFLLTTPPLLPFEPFSPIFLFAIESGLLLGTVLLAYILLSQPMRQIRDDLE